MPNVLPTKGNLLAMKRSRELARTGFDLMDRKRNILVRELMALIEQAADIQSRMEQTFSDAYAALENATISLGSCSSLAEGVKIDRSLALQYRSVMGVEIPILSADTSNKYELPYGLVETTSELDDAYAKFSRAKRLLRDLAETENTIFRLAYTIKKTQKRANALKNVVLPDLDETIKRITDSLEEKEREEFVRLKVIKAHK